MGIKGQFKIQQMAFMIIGVFFFFILVGIFFVNFQIKDIQRSAQDLQVKQAISSLKVISAMSEFSCSSSEDYCVDEDKLLIMSGNLSKAYSDFFPVSSIKVYKVYPAFDKVVKCPAQNCNYFEVYNSGEKDLVEYSSYVSICKKDKINGYAYEVCEIGKILVGVKNVGK